MRTVERVREFNEGLNIKDKFFVYGTAIAAGGVALMGGAHVMEQLVDVHDTAFKVADWTGRIAMCGGFLSAFLPNAEVFGRD